MRKYLLYRFLLCGFMLVAASGCSSKGSAQAAQAVATDVSDGLELPLPSLPETLKKPVERANYIIAHFWDALDVSDTARVHSMDFIEQNFSNFISVFPIADDEGRKIAVETLLHRAEADGGFYRLLIDTAEKYLFDPNSPMLSEEYYILFLERTVNSRLLTEYTRVRLQQQLRVARKNRPGMKAADFGYTSREGKRMSLHKTVAGRDMLLIFYDPDCEHCKEIMASLKENDLLADAVSTGKLSVLAVYSGDERELWEKTAGEFPASWTVGYESGALQENGLYVLRAMPTLYLLSKDKQVLVKDISTNQLFQMLYEGQDKQ